MSFKSLEQRFNEKVNELYAGATTKFENGKPSAGPNDDPLIVRRPGNGYWGPMESRATPIESAKQDLRRLTLFQLRPNGIQFLAKQQLLQTGNTFEFTRALNPAFVVGNAVPFLHIKRNLRPLNELIGKTDTSPANVKSMGQLQNTTYNNLKSKSLPNFPEIQLPTAFNRTGIGETLRNRLLAPLRALRDTVANTISSFSPSQKRNVGEIIDKWGPESWKVSRPELVTYIPRIQKILYDAQRSQAPQLLVPVGINLSVNVGMTSFIKYFDAAESIRSAQNTIPSVPASVVAKRRPNGQLPQSPRSKTGNISYIKDPANTLDSTSTLISAVRALTTPPAYNRINNTFNDPINVSFAMGNQSPIKFRAFITNLTEASNPQYQTFQYIGRTEKFVNYIGIQRDVSFKLAVIAFGKDELDVVWRRINYLTGLTFPYGFTRGLLQPNIVRITIGNVYRDQPGYITSLTTNFNEPGDSWEIDNGKQVPIGATMDMKFTLIEKATKVANSPFYGITEEMRGFDKQILVPKPLAQNNPSTDAPVAQSQISEPFNFFEESNLTIAERISAGEALDESGLPINNPP